MFHEIPCRKDSRKNYWVKEERAVKTVGGGAKKKGRMQEESLSYSGLDDSPGIKWGLWKYNQGKSPFHILWSFNSKENEKY